MALLFHFSEKKSNCKYQEQIKHCRTAIKNTHLNYSRHVRLRATVRPSTQQPCTQDCTRPIKENFERQHHRHKRSFTLGWSSSKKKMEASCYKILFKDILKWKSLREKVFLRTWRGHIWAITEPGVRCNLCGHLSELSPGGEWRNGLGHWGCLGVVLYRSLGVKGIKWKSN